MLRHRYGYNVYRLVAVSLFATFALFVFNYYQLFLLGANKNKLLLLLLLNIHILKKEYVQLIKSLYWNHNMAVRIRNKVTNFKDIRDGVRQE